MQRFYRDAKRAEGSDHLPPNRVRLIGADVKVASLIVWLKRQQRSIGMLFEEEKFEFGSGEVFVAHFGSFG